MNRNTRKELDPLSKEVFGSSSRWQKLVSKGHPELLTQEVEEPVPSDKEGGTVEIRKVQVPLKTATGANQYYTKHYTVESIREYMLNQRAMMDQIRAQIKKMNEEAKAKREAEEKAQRLIDEASGSANVTV